jgi:hypothetical protein
VYEYIARQQEHHKARSFKEEFIMLLRKHQIDYDERYIWSWPGGRCFPGSWNVSPFQGSWVGCLLPTAYAVGYYAAAPDGASEPPRPRHGDTTPDIRPPAAVGPSAAVGPPAVSTASVPRVPSVPSFSSARFGILRDFLCSTACCCGLGFAGFPLPRPGRAHRCPGRMGPGAL